MVISDSYAKVILIHNKLVRCLRAYGLGFCLLLGCLLQAFRGWGQVDTLSSRLVDTLAFPAQRAARDSVLGDGDALDAPIYTRARDSMRYDIANRTVSLYGEAKLRYKAQEFTAARIHLDMGKRTLRAEGVRDENDSVVGRPVFNDGESTYKMDGILYSFSTRKARITGVVTEVPEGFLHGEVIKKMPNDEVNVARGKFTTCDAEHPHYYFALTKAKVIPNDKIITGFTYLTIADLPTPLFIPFGFFPNTTKRTSGFLLPEYGEEQARGFFIRRGGVYFGLSDYADLSLMGGVYSKGSWEASLTSRYAWRYKFTGSVSVNYSSVRTGHEGASDFSQTNSYMVNWSHTQDRTSHPNTDFSANVSFGSSSYNRHNSVTPQDYLNNQIMSSVALNQRFPGTPFSLSVALNHSQNTRDSMVTLGLPQMSLSMNRIYPLRREGGGKQSWYERVGLSYGANLRNTLSIKEDRLFTPEALRRMRNGLEHTASLSTSFTLANHINISPSVSYREAWYLQTIRYHYDEVQQMAVRDTVGEFARAWQFSTSVGTSTKLYGMFAFGQNPWVKAIRHVMTPSVSLSYHPDFSKAPFTAYRRVQRSPAGDSLVYSIFEQGLYGGPPRGESGTVSFSLGNNLEMKRNLRDTTQKDEKVSLLDNLALHTSYNMLADSMNWSNVQISASTRLFNFLNLNASSSFSPYAANERGVAYNKYHYQETGRWLRFTNFNLSGSFSLDQAIEGRNANPHPVLPIGYLPAYATGVFSPYPAYVMLQYANFKAPWHLSFNYNYSYSVYGTQHSSLQTVSLNGGVSFGDRWRAGFSTGYDIDRLALSVTSFNVSCDLHCWEMSMMLVPFGTLRSFSFRINVKSGMLRDLKYEKRQHYIENLLR